MLKTAYDKRTKKLKQQAETAGKKLSNVFIFCEEVFDEGQELLILVTEGEPICSQAVDRALSSVIGRVTKSRRFLQLFR